MSYRLVYSPASLADQDRIWFEVWEASMDLETTENYLTGLRNAIRQKLSFPKSGSPLCWNGEFTGIYFISYKAYLAFYQVRGDRMEVGRILFSRSDYMKALFGVSS